MYTFPLFVYGFIFHIFDIVFACLVIVILI